MSVDGFVGMEAGSVLKRIGEVLPWKRGKGYGQVMDWIRSSLTFSVIRATGLCLQGSRVPWRSGRGFEDGWVCPFMVLTKYQD